MSKIVFTQAACKIANLYPFSLTRKVQDFRIGGLTIREKWERCLKLPSFDIAGESSLPGGEHITLAQTGNEKAYLVACNMLPDKDLLRLVKKMKPDEAIVTADEEMLVRLITTSSFDKAGKLTSPRNTILYKNRKQLVEHFSQLYLLNKEAIGFDFELLTRRRRTAPVDKSNGLSNAGKIFIEKGATVKHAFLNADDGPVYISKNALIMEGSCIRGPVFIGENAVLKMGAKIYGATTIGPGCTVGGEIKNSIFFANSNKAHDGYIGDAVVGEWCNFGAGTSCSNMKNNIGDIDFHLADTFWATGLKKCGVIMGDYSRTAINTAINTATVIGVSAHVFGSGLTPKIIPNFSWGFDKRKKYALEKALRDANAWKQLKGETLSEAETKRLTELYNKI